MNNSNEVFGITGEVLVQADNGPIEAQKLVDAENTLVFGFNQKNTLKKYPCKCTKLESQEPIVKLQLEPHIIVRCTKNMKILTTKGYVAVGDLKKKDVIKAFSREMNIVSKDDDGYSEIYKVELDGTDNYLANSGISLKNVESEDVTPKALEPEVK